MYNSKRPNKNTVQLATNVSFQAKELLEQMSVTKNLNVSRLIAIAIEKEFSSDAPFEYDTTLPAPNFELDLDGHSSTLMDFMKKSCLYGMPLDLLCVIRFDIGIQDKSTFLQVFANCLDLGFIERFKRNRGINKGVWYYRPKMTKADEQAEERKREKEAKEYEQFLKWKKKYGDI